MFSEIAREYLEDFSKEDQEVRDEIATFLSSYNKLVSMHAKTFEELSLMRIAKQRGIDYTDPLFSYKSIKPDCPRCGSNIRVSRAKENTYICNGCNHKFVLNQPE